MSPTMTLNYGVRYGVQLPGVPDNENYTMGTFEDLCGVSGAGSDGYGLGRGCNIGQPGNPDGLGTHLRSVHEGHEAVECGCEQPGAELGVAWRPNVQTGWLRALLGDPEQATVRASFSVDFNTEGTDRYRNIYTANPGTVRGRANRSEANGNLVLPGETWPLLFSQTGRLGPPAVCTGTVTAACYPETLVTPFSATAANPVARVRPEPSCVVLATVLRGPPASTCRKTRRSRFATSGPGATTSRRRRTGMNRR